LHLKDPAKYRSMIKGFHLAFNVREKLVEEGITDGTFKPKKVLMSAQELKDNANTLKQNRLNNQDLREKIKTD